MYSMLVSCMDTQTLSRMATIGVDAPLVDVAPMLSDKRNGLVIVCNPDGSMAGVITKTDVVRNFGLRCESTKPTMVADVMTRDVTSCSPASSLGDVLSLKQKKGFSNIPVIDGNGVPTGVVNIADLLGVLMANKKIDLEHLHNYISGVGYR